MSITYLAFLQGMFAAACLLGIGAALTLVVFDVRERKRENDRLERVLRLAERRVGVETPRRVG